MGRHRVHNTHLPRHLQRKRGAYYYVIRKGGRVVWTALGKDYGAALRRWAEFEAEAVQAATVADLVAGYLAACESTCRPATVAGYRAFSRRLLAVFGRVPVGDLKRADVARYVMERNSHAGNREKALLSAAYTWGLNCGLVACPDPTKGLNVRAREAPRRRYVTDDELARLLDAAGRLRPAIELAYLTGMRRADLLALRLTAATDAGIAYESSKTGATVLIGWTDALRAAWKGCAGDRIGAVPAVAKTTGRPYTAQGWRQAWERIRMRAGLPDVRFHDLRRKAGSDLSLEDAGDLLAHSDLGVTRRHYRAKPKPARPAR